MRNIRWPNNAQFAHGFKPHGFTLVSDVCPRATFCIGALDDLVVNIGDVRDKAYRQAGPGEVPAQDVIDQGGAAMTQMGRPIDGWTT